LHQKKKESKVNQRTEPRKRKPRTQTTNNRASQKFKNSKTSKNGTLAHNSGKKEHHLSKTISTTILKRGITQKQKKKRSKNRCGKKQKKQGVGGKGKHKHKKTRQLGGNQEQKWERE